jgi:5-dehydro-2-deoxygluconokinase
MSAAQWQAIDAIIAERDPYCRGVVLLGLAAPIDELMAGFREARASTTCRGFAVGRTIFHDASKNWLAGACDDATLKRLVRERYETLIRVWREARSVPQLERVAS